MHSRRTLARRLGALLCVAILAGTAVACGDDSDGGSSATDTHTASNGDVFNDADVEFATHMIPHHAQAIQLVTLTDGRRLDPALLELANQIRDAQVPEVETMTDWLTAWGEEVPETVIDHANAGHHGSDMPSMDDSTGEGLPGMVSAEDLQALQSASDQEFPDLWLELMMEHHQGAIEMARTQQAEGAFPDAISLAESIETSQQAEMDQIEELLGR